MGKLSTNLVTVLRQPSVLHSLDRLIDRMCALVEDRMRSTRKPSRRQLAKTA